MLPEPIASSISYLKRNDRNDIFAYVFVSLVSNSLGNTTLFGLFFSVYKIFSKKLKEEPTDIQISETSQRINHQFKFVRSTIYDTLLFETLTMTK